MYQRYVCVKSIVGLRYPGNAKLIWLLTNIEGSKTKNAGCPYKLCDDDVTLDR